jgi:hypothetical protein
VERITTRGQLRALARGLGLTDGWREPFERGVTATTRGHDFSDTGDWGLEAEGRAAIGDIPEAAVEQYIIVRQYRNSVAAVSLVSLVNWAATRDPELLDRIENLTAELSAAGDTIFAQEKVISGEEADRLPEWPLWVDDDGSGDRALRCMAAVPTGKLGAHGKPQGRDCREVICGDNLAEVTAVLRQHITTVEHLPVEEEQP